MNDEPGLQHQAQALGDPSRFAIFEHIARSATPVDVAELTELMGFNHNAIRQHLVKLLDADLISQSTQRRLTRGRPRLTYQARTDAFDRFQNRPGGSYQRLAAMLLDLATSGDSPYEVGRRSTLSAESQTTADLDAANLDAASDDTVAALALRLELDGFKPSVNGSTIELGRCPFADLAVADPDVVCELHRGLIDGYLDGQTGDATATLSQKSPRLAGCTVVINSIR